MNTLRTWLSAGIVSLSVLPAFGTTEPTAIFQMDELTEGEMALMAFFQVSAKLCILLERIEPGLSEKGILCSECSEELSYAELTGQMLHKDNIDKLNTWFDFLTEKPLSSKVYFYALEMAESMHVECPNCRRNGWNDGGI